MSSQLDPGAKARMKISLAEYKYFKKTGKLPVACTTSPTAQYTVESTVGSTAHIVAELTDESSTALHNETVAAAYVSHTTTATGHSTVASTVVPDPAAASPRATSPTTTTAGNRTVLPAEPAAQLPSWDGSKQNPPASVALFGTFKLDSSYPSTLRPESGSIRCAEVPVPDNVQFTPNSSVGPDPIDRLKKRRVLDLVDNPQLSRRGVEDEKVAVDKDIAKLNKPGPPCPAKSTTSRADYARESSHSPQTSVRGQIHGIAKDNSFDDSQPDSRRDKHPESDQKCQISHQRKTSRQNVHAQDDALNNECKERDALTLGNRQEVDNFTTTSLTESVNPTNRRTRRIEKHNSGDVKGITRVVRKDKRKYDELETEETSNPATGQAPDTSARPNKRKALKKRVNSTNTHQIEKHSSGGIKGIARVVCKEKRKYDELETEEASNPAIEQAPDTSARPNKRKFLMKRVDPTNRLMHRMGEQRSGDIKGIARVVRKDKRKYDELETEETSNPATGQAPDMSARPNKRRAPMKRTRPVKPPILIRTSGIESKDLSPESTTKKTRLSRYKFRHNSVKSESSGARIFETTATTSDVDSEGAVSDSDFVVDDENYREPSKTKSGSKAMERLLFR